MRGDPRGLKSPSTAGKAVKVSGSAPVNFATSARRFAEFALIENRESLRGLDDEKYEIRKIRFESVGIGRLRYMNGSNVALTVEHSGQLSRLLNWP